MCGVIVFLLNFSESYDYAVMDCVSDTVGLVIPMLFNRTDSYTAAGIAL